MAQLGSSSNVNMGSNTAGITLTVPIATNVAPVNQVYAVTVPCDEDFNSAVFATMVAFQHEPI